MKTLTHIVLPIVILMAVVGVVAYITQNTQRSSSFKPDSGVQPSAPSAPPVEYISFFGEELPALNESDLEERRPEEIEHPSTNHRDYFFYSKQPTDFRLSYIKNCKCTNLEIGMLPMSDEELAALDAHPNLTKFSGLAAAMSSMKFEPLPEGDDNQVSGTIIHGSPPGKLKRPYVLRVAWKSQSPADPLSKADTIQVKLFARGEGSPLPTKTDIYIKSIVVPSAGFYPPNFDLGELTTGGTQSAECYVFSGTRDRLSVKLTLAGADGPGSVEPCAEISPCVPLTREELEKLPQMLGKDFAAAKFRCAYRFTITLHEQRGNDVLELGPLDRRLTADFDQKEINPGTLHVKALVRGGVRLLNGDSRDRIPLHVFKSARGTAARVRLRADDPKLEIAVERTGDSKLKATLGSPVVIDGRKEWDLDVVVEPNALVGIIPETAVVILKTVGPHPRHMRIPLAGIAER